MSESTEPTKPNIFECDGVNVFFINWDERRISGWNRAIKVGDLVHVKMQSGKTAELEITELKHCSDPTDQFFGRVKDVRYL